MLTCILQPYSRANTENPYPILDLFPDLLMLTGLRKVAVLPAAPIFKCLTGKLSQAKLFKQLINFAENDTLFYTKTL